MMDFISKLPPTKKGNNTIWVINDHLRKSAHFIPLKIRKNVHAPAQKAIHQRDSTSIGSPVSIVSDGDNISVTRFCATLNKAMGTLHFSNAYHLQTDDQTKRMNQTLEDMLRACILDFKT